MIFDNEGVELSYNLAHLFSAINSNNKEQVNEIKNIKWCSLNEVIKSIRKYEKWKIILVKEAFSYFINYIKLYKKIYYG